MKELLVEADPPTWPGQSEKETRGVNLGVIESNRKERGIKNSIGYCLL